MNRICDFPLCDSNTNISIPTDIETWQTTSLSKIYNLMSEFEENIKKRASLDQLTARKKIYHRNELLVYESTFSSMNNHTWM